MPPANKKPTKANPSRKDDEDLTEESENSRGPVIGEDGTAEEYMKREHPNTNAGCEGVVLVRMTIDPYTGAVSRTKGGPKVESYTFGKDGKEDLSKRVTRRQNRNKS